MVFKYLPSYGGVGEVSQIAAEASDDVIAEVAQKVLEEAIRLARDAGLDDYASSLRVDTGARPKGRGFRRVIADDDNATAVEHGDSDNDRLRILGRASGVNVFPDAE